MKKIFIIIISLCSVLFARDYYVSPLGTDDFTSIQNAVDMAQAGDTVYIKAGTYNERVFFSTSGTPSHPIVFKRYGQDHVVIDGTGIDWSESWGGLLDVSDVNYITISGLEVKHSTHAGYYMDNVHDVIIQYSHTYDTFSSGIGVWESNNIVLSHNEVELACNDGGEECISIATSHHVSVIYNEVHHAGPGSNGGEGIDVKEGSHDVQVKYNHVHHMSGADRPALYADAWDLHTYHILFEANRVHDIKANAIAVASEMGGLLEDVTFVNNIIYNVQSEGMIVGGWTADGQTVSSNPVEHISIINNTFYNFRGDGIYVGNEDAKDIKIYNNIIQSRHNQFPIYIDYIPVSQVEIRHNLLDRDYDAYGQIGDRVGNPLFIDALHGDYHLQSNSPAINAGIPNNLSLLDYDKNNRQNNGQWDIGAYEYVGTNIAFLIPILYLLL